MDMAIGILVGLTFGGILMYWGEKKSDEVINELTEKLIKAYDETGEVADKWKAAVDSLNNYWKDCYSLDQVLEMEDKWVAKVEKLTAQLKNTRYAYSYRLDKCKELENRVSEFEEVA